MLLDSIPQPGAGLISSSRVPDDTSLAVFVASVHGIDVDDPDSIQFTVDDSELAPYTRSLNSDTMRVIEVESNNNLNLLWVVYDRSLETTLPMAYSHDATLHVAVKVEDIAGNILPPAHYDFKIESEAEHEQALNNLPEFEFIATANAAGEQDSGVEVVSGELEGARIEYSGKEPLTPMFGPMNEIEAVAGSGMEDVGLPLNMLPHTVFNTPVKVYIPAPDGFDIGEIGIYYHNGVEWQPACDKFGNLLPGGEGWMVAESRVNHYETSPPLIEIQVYHFSAAQGGVVVVNSGGTAGSSSGSGGGAAWSCFIDAAALDFEGKPAIGLLALLLVLGTVGALLLVKALLHSKWNGFLS
jgi:hypothetical protein